jgi:hypothetical protein
MYTQDCSIDGPVGWMRMTPAPVPPPRQDTGAISAFAFSFFSCRNLPAVHVPRHLSQMLGKKRQQFPSTGGLFSSGCTAVNISKNSKTSY